MELNNLGVQGSNDGVGHGRRFTEICPRCNSMNTKFCYYNNYSLSQPRHYCKTCHRYWTQGGVCRNIPVGGATYRRRPRVPRATLAPQHPASRGCGRPSHGRSHCYQNPFNAEFGRPMSSFGPLPNSNLSFFQEYSAYNHNNINSIVNVNNTVPQGFGNFLPVPPLIPNAWHQESLLMSSDPTDNMFLWGLDAGSWSGSSSDGGAPPPPVLDEMDVINDQWTDQDDLPVEDTTPPPPPPSA